MNRIRVAAWWAGLLFFALETQATCSVTCTATVPRSGTAGVAVAFESSGSPCDCASADSYAWSFGDGNVSSEQNPSHIYAVAGTYNWDVTVSADGVNCTKSGSITITSAGGVVPHPGTYVGTINGATFELDVNTSNRITRYKVSFGGACGLFGSVTTTFPSGCTINNGSFTCSTATCIAFGIPSASISGSFPSETTVSGNATVKFWPNQFSSCCTSTPSFSASVPAPLAAAASGDVTTGTAPLTVNFTGSASGGTAPYTYSWNFGDCSPAEAAQNPSHAFEVGNWSTVLTVTDSTNATAEAVVPVTANPGVPVSLGLDAPATAAVGVPFSVTVTARDVNENVAPTYTGQVGFSSSDGAATLPANYTFTGGDAGIHTFTNEVTLATPGTRSLTVTDTSDGALTATANVNVGHATATAATSSPNPTAQGATVTLSATVTSAAGTPTGTVTFYDGITLLGSVSLSGGVAAYNTAALEGGPHGITAQYSGDPTFLTSTSPVHTHYVLLSAPTGVTATATTTTSVNVAWDALDGATEYEVFRSTNNTTFTSLGTIAATDYVDGSAAANTTYFYRVRGRDAGANNGATSSSDLATTVIFVDDPLVVGATKLRALHITQLRTAVNAMRTAAALGAATFTDPTLTGVKIKKIHIDELRTGLAAARSVLGLSAISFTDPTLAVGITKAKQLHVAQLRIGVK